MDAILNNISDLSWWLTIIMSAVFALLLPKISNHLLKVVQQSSKVIKKLIRSLIARRQMRIKNARRNQSLVNYEIARTNSYFLILIIIICLYLAWMVSGSFLMIFKASPLLAITLSLPIYISEAFWLVNDNYIRDLIKSRSRIE